MKRLLPVIMAMLIPMAMGASCKPKPPEPTPTPTPTPTPGVPDKGVPLGPEKLLRTSGTRLKIGESGPQFDMVMAVPCCNTFQPGGVETPSLWPMASEAWMDYTHERGAANAFHFRMGPFYADVETEVEWQPWGGPYVVEDWSWNPNFWQKVRELTWYAYERGWYVEVVVVDSWGCKYSKWGNRYVQWPQDAIDACGTTWHPEHERFVRKVVEELGCFGNVIWALGNEEGQVPDSNDEWFLRERDVIRSAEQQVGCGFTHIIGTGRRGIQSQVDYAITHAREPLTVPIAGRWTINNEHNPEYTPAQEQANFAAARRLGLAWALWRAGMDDAAFDDTLARFKSVVEGHTEKCLAGICPPEDRYIKAKDGTHNYLDSTMRCKNRTYCEAATGIPGTVDCALGPEGTEQRIACELEHSPGCLRWQFRNANGSWERCLPAQHPVASCDHFDRWIYWEGPYLGPCETDETGEPIAGNEMVPHGKTGFRACDSLGVACSNVVEVDR